MRNDTAMPSTTLTVRLSPELKDQLASLAEHTQRTRSFLANEAIEHYVRRELAIVAGIERGLADLQAGRVAPHEDVDAQMARLIEAGSQETR